MRILFLSTWCPLYPAIASPPKYKWCVFLIFGKENRFLEIERWYTQEDLFYPLSLDNEAVLVSVCLWYEGRREGRREGVGEAGTLWQQMGKLSYRSMKGHLWSIYPGYHNIKWEDVPSDTLRRIQREECRTPFLGSQLQMAKAKDGPICHE